MTAGSDTPCYDVVVIGCGGMGSAALYHLARRGVKVLGIDRFDPPHEQGSSHGRSRIIRENYWEDPAYVPLVHRAYDLWEELDAGQGRLLTTTGGLLMGVPGGEIATGARAAAERFGLELEDLTAEDVAQRFPPFRLPAGMTAVYEPRAGILDPEACVSAHLAGAREAGADAWTDTVVHGWHRDGAFVIDTSSGSVRAERLVVAAGSWLPKLIPAMAHKLRVERQIQFWFDAPDAMPAGPYPIFACEEAAGHWFYGFPDQGLGIKAAAHHDGEDADPDVPRDAPTEEEESALRDRLGLILPIGPATQALTCMYTNTPDMNFLIGRLPQDPDIIVIGGGSGHAFKFTSAIGEAAADLATDVVRDDLALFDPARLLD